MKRLKATTNCYTHFENKMVAAQKSVLVINSYLFIFMGECKCQEHYYNTICSLLLENIMFLFVAARFCISLVSLKLEMNLKFVD